MKSYDVLRLILSCPVVLLLCSEAAALQNDSIFTMTNKLEIRNDILGEVHVEQVPFGNVLFFPEQELLREEEVQREIEVTVEQRDRLKDLFNRIDELKRSFASKFVSVGHDKKELINNFRIAQRNVWGEVTDVLLEHQLSRLKEVHRFVNMRKAGVVNFVKAIARERNIDLNSREFSSTLNEKIVEIKKKSRQLARGHLDKVTALLDQTQRDKLTRLLPEKWEERIDVETLFLDLCNPEIIHPEETKKSVAEVLFELSGIRMSNDGSWKRVRPDAGFTSSEVVNLAWNIVEHYDHLNELDLSDDQLSGISDLIRQRSEENLKLRQQSHSPVSDTAYREAKAETYRRFDARFLKLIDESQIERLRPRIEGQSLICNGILTGLSTNKWLIDQLELSENQSKRIAKACNTLLPIIEEELRKLEREAVDAIKEVLPDDLAEVVAAATGDPPKHIPPSLAAFR